uniref:hypothetical protein n=1 Tax=Amycolatopsis sp. CA-096443 TaxID=3239919 RepID=UPI003F49A0E0
MPLVSLAGGLGQVAGPEGAGIAPGSWSPPARRPCPRDRDQLTLHTADGGIEYEKIRTPLGPRYQMLLDWLQYRRECWPNTANPHLIIHKYTVLETKAANGKWVSDLLNKQPDATTTLTGPYSSTCRVVGGQVVRFVGGTVVASLCCR